MKNDNMEFDPMLDSPMIDEGKVTHHYHRNEYGALIKCYHSCKNVLTDYAFWIGLTLGFPLEHALWEHVWPFSAITKWMGL